MKSPFLSNLEEVISNVKLQKMAEGKTVTKAIAMFDLADSTRLKIEKGHSVAKDTVFKHNLICRNISKYLGGEVVKEMGDGLIIQFDEPEKACLAAINIKKAMSGIGLVSKGAITFGRVEEVTLNDIQDILGAPVDLCSRIEKLTHKDQILIDETLHGATLSVLRDYDISVSRPMDAFPKGLSKVRLYEITSNESALQNRLNTQLQIHEEGRLDISEKVAFIENARNEIIEVGSGLREFTNYFDRRRPEEFKQPVSRLLARGVNFKCFAIDPEIAHVFYSSSEPQYAQEIHQTLERLKTVQEEFRNMHLKGTFEIYLHPYFPLFHSQCIDGDDMEYGQMIVSNYLYETRRSEAPVLQFSRSSNPKIFETYWTSIKKVMARSKLF